MELHKLRMFRSGGLYALTAWALLACSSGLQVRSDIDPAADFSSYRSWDFFDPMGIEGGYNSPVYGERFREAISLEMNERGYRRADSPDLLVNVTLRADDKVRMTSYTAPYLSGAYYHRPGGPYYGSALGVGAGVSSRATVTTAASVFIDLVDVDRKQVVWQGVAVVDVTDEVAQRLRESVYTAVEQVFRQYPQRAGQN